jgi:hypothetical protein
VNGKGPRTADFSLLCPQRRAHCCGEARSDSYILAHRCIAAKLDGDGRTFEEIATAGLEEPA